MLLLGDMQNDKLFFFCRLNFPRLTWHIISATALALCQEDTQRHLLVRSTRLGFILFYCVKFPEVRWIILHCYLWRCFRDNEQELPHYAVNMEWIRSFETERRWRSGLRARAHVFRPTSLFTNSFTGSETCKNKQTGSAVDLVLTATRSVAPAGRL